MGTKKRKKQSKAEINIDNILLKKRTIFLYDDIDEKSAKKVAKQLIVLDTQKKADITLYVNSCGGYCTDGLAIIDTIQGIKSKVTTIITGFAASMGAMISISGDKRYITKHGIWMQHPMAGGTYDYYQFVKDRVKFMEMLEGKMTILLKERTNLNPPDYKKIANGELWLDAEEALAKGVVDKII